ncbi:hypothetical protein [Gallibacter sp. Marseille-QA0791]|uniref:hypothetical protein n=1 Tax=Gallibacter sp. Marseille-QA0791 TaxID=3378781 RepID=UPI003D14FA99
MDGYIKLHRKMTEWEWYSDSNTKTVFLHLLLEANFKPTKYRGVELEAGQLVVTQEALAMKLGLSRQNVRTAIEHLKSTKEITTRKEKGITVTTIENWAMYQGGEGIEKSESTKELTIDQPTTNQRLTKQQKKKEKNVKNNNIYIMPALGEFGNVYLTEEELEKLKERFPYDWQVRIERLSEYVASKGKRYKSHYATILSWARKDGRNAETGASISRENAGGASEKEYSADGSGFKT